MSSAEEIAAVRKEIEDEMLAIYIANRIDKAQLEEGPIKAALDTITTQGIEKIISDEIQRTQQQ